MSAEDDQMKPAAANANCSRASGSARAVEIVRRHGPLTPASFAQLAWPDSPSWAHSYKAGPRSSVNGMAVVKAAGTWLANLYRAGKLHRTQHGRGWLYSVPNNEVCRGSAANTNHHE